MTMTQNGRLAIDDNDKPVMGGTSSADNATIINSSFDPLTRRLLVDNNTSGGTVTSVSVVTANGFAGSVANPTTTPAITLSTTITGILQGNGTAISAVTIGAGLDFTGGTLATTVANEATDTSCFLGFYTAASGNLGAKTNTNLQFNSNTGLLTTLNQVMTGGLVVGFSGTPVAGTIQIGDLDFVLDYGGGTSPLLNFDDTDALIYDRASNVFTFTTAAVNPIQILSGVIRPGANDGTALGSTALSFSDLFLASGALINIANSNWVATHSSGILTVSTGDLRVTTAGTNSASVVTVGGTQALTGKTINGLTITSSTGTLSITNGKTFAVTNSITLSGTDSTVMTFPTTTATIARTDAAQTFVGIQTIPQVVNTPLAATVSSNAATITRASRINNFTNSSAAGMTITLSTSGALDGDWLEVRIYDFSAVAQSITWVNTENSTAIAPTTSNGSTTLPVSVGFQYNGATSKWRCLASA